MAHFAKLMPTASDTRWTVERVEVVNNAELLDDGIESEAKGIAFMRSLYGDETEWRQTSYNATFRKNFAGVGFTYDSDLDAYIPPQPFPSWTLDEETCQWQPPVPYPDDGNPHTWDEDEQEWV